MVKTATDHNSNNKTATANSDT